MSVELDASAGLEPEILEVLEYRRAARLIVADTSRDYQTRSLAIVGLVERGRREAALPAWVQEAIWREAGDFLRTGKVPASPPSSDPVIGALRALRQKQLVRCPSCHRAIPSEETLARWEAMRWAELIEHQRAEVPA